MIQRLHNLIQLSRVLKERGNWPLIRRSRRQLRDFIWCRNDLNRKNPLSALVYWIHMLKGLDVLIWRLETFGFLYQPGAGPEDRSRLNRYIES
ncbi:MAG: hypothetical protein GWM98_12645 [Nitrospinaceae bacterium]|nr:hypothetical protein [Nitrospinaceae bacterium]NIR55175.1 hypothetical protein [Nitrospinaceae bacterium]NIS85599.1 hypothetical protein [Nitrospinaceae bacterium]NIT82445.1 hypothetical protein [Nitrospinaceae bacterium]NIU44658.1 hypothetical protein [Nitrospinaceae bacterium]